MPHLFLAPIKVLRYNDKAKQEISLNSDTLTFNNDIRKKKKVLGKQKVVAENGTHYMAQGECVKISNHCDEWG